MGAAAPIITGVGAGVSAYGSYKQGFAQKKYYDYLAAGSHEEANLALEQGDQESSNIQDTAELKTEQLRKNQAELEGSQAAVSAANGTAGSVTAADIATDTQRKAQFDRMLVKYNADRASWLAKTNAANRAWSLNRQADEDAIAGQNAANAGKINAFTSLLSGSSQVASSWSRLKRSQPSDEAN